MTLRDGVSLIYITSPIPSHPGTELLDASINSMKSTTYPFYERVIVYDFPTSSNINYNKYKKKVKKKYPTYTHLELKKHGHFIGTLKKALLYCKTKYFLLVQHDITLIGAFPVKQILDAVFNWNIIFTHHKPKGLTKPTHWFPIIQKPRRLKVKGKIIGPPSFLLKTFGWSERIFLSKTKFMLDKINEIQQKKLSSKFVESVFNKQFTKMFKKLENIKTYKDIPKKSKHQIEYNNYWDTWKCYAIKSKVCYHKHLFGRTAK